MWCIPPDANAEFVCAMENVLAVYKRPFDAAQPVVCFDEKSKQLVGEICTPIAAAPGRVACHDYEYVRNGTANVFLMVEPLRGWRHVNVTSRRTKLDFAQQMKELIEVHYPKAERVTLVMDNLNTHRLSCLYEAFPPDQARRLIEKIEVVHTPKHGSWLNRAECELRCWKDNASANESVTRPHYANESRFGIWTATPEAKPSPGNSKPPTQESSSADFTRRLR